METIWSWGWSIDVARRPAMLSLRIVDPLTGFKEDSLTSSMMDQ